MSASYKTYCDFLIKLGIEEVPHTGKSYLAHLVNLYRLMESEGCSPELCLAGMFHSIYGTEVFQGFKLPLESRSEIRQLIGERAERLAYLNCAMERASFDRAVSQTHEPYRFLDRLTQESVVLPLSDFDDLCRIHLYDWLEQAARSRWGMDYRRTAYRQMAERLGGAALQAYDRVFTHAETMAPRP